jgi:hypothetical protein
LLAVFYFGISLGRSVMFFNNPNQLGYWALLVCTLFFVVTNRLSFLNYLRAFVYMASLFMAVLSLSKAAMAGIVILLGLYYLRKPVYLDGRCPPIVGCRGLHVAIRFDSCRERAKPNVDLG